jgi:hypothetical protein
MKDCPHCHRPLIEIDYYGEWLIGCIDCNRWGGPRDTTLPMQLLEDDLGSAQGEPGAVGGIGSVLVPQHGDLV